MGTKAIEFGIGFVTGRPNICKLINSYYNNMVEQIKRYDREVNLTIFLLFDMNYQFTIRTDFYNLIPDVYKNIKVKYITPEDIEEQKKILVSRYELNQEDVELFLGNGHAKGRNTVMYYALKSNIDYLLFWDDDEYPVACMKSDDDTIEWRKQDNILEHLNSIKHADVTIGNHCGYISPIPYIELGEEIAENDFKDYVEAISNEVVSWDSIKEKILLDNGITWANKEKLADKKIIHQKDNWVVGSTLALNMRHIEKIPAFYNPPAARGEDAFFSTCLDNSKILRLPVYHFHDGFLKYTCIMQENYPKKLRRIKPVEEDIKTRFLKASMGWIKYKPLFLYITDRENYRSKIEKIKKQLETSIPKINSLFEDESFTDVLKTLKEYDKKVEQHYNEYVKVNELWDKIKLKVNAD